MGYYERVKWMVLYDNNVVFGPFFKFLLEKIEILKFLKTLSTHFVSSIEFYEFISHQK